MAAGASSGVIEKSDNIKQVWNYKYNGGTELAAQGKYVYSAELNGDARPPSRGTMPEKGGIHIFDVSKKTPKRVGFLHCPGNDNDVEVVRPGLIAVGHHQNICNPISAGGQSAHGLFLVDVKNPKRPTIVGRVLLPSGGSSHTIRPHPTQPYIYVNPGGTTNGRGVTYIIDVKNPRKPEIAARFTPHPMGCHDFSFFVDDEKDLGFCAGIGESQIWDTSDALNPVIVGRIHNPAIQFMHYATPSFDGKLLAIDDEAFAAHECHTGQSPTGRVWIYDISNPALPILQSSFAPPRGGDGTIGHYAGWVPSWCLSHGLDWQPGTYNLAVTWFTGGVSVLNLNNPVSPQEVAHFQPEDAATYSTLWHRNRLYTNDMGDRGLEVFEVKGLPKPE
jgi:hypothetical protein